MFWVCRSCYRGQAYCSTPCHALARRWLPAEVSSHPKQGFSIPPDRMVGADFHTMLVNLLRGRGARVRAILNVRLVDCWLHLFRRVGPADPAAP